MSVTVKESSGQHKLSAVFPKKKKKKSPPPPKKKKRRNEIQKQANRWRKETMTPERGARGKG